MVAGWVELERGFSVEVDVIRGLVIDILAMASAQIDQFRGEESIRNWIYRLATKRLAKFWKGRYLFTNRLPDVEEKYLARVYQQPRQERILLWLRYGTGLNLPEIALILSQPVVKIVKKIKAARSQLLSGEMTIKREEACKGCVQAFWDHSDGMLKGDEDTTGYIDEHLRECSACQSDTKRLEVFEHALRYEMRRRWALPVFNADEMLDFYTAIPAKAEKRYFINLASRWIKAGWTGLFIFVFILVGVIWMRMTGDESDLPPNPTPVVRFLPDLIQSGLSPEILFQNPTREKWYQYVAQDQSADGSWMVYTVFEFSSGELENNYLVRVFLYNTAMKTSQVIYESQPIALRTIYVWLNPPSISADGGWITFAAPQSLTQHHGQTCLTEAGTPCLDIYLYERATGEITLVTQGWNGAQANGDSYAPAISAEGQVLAFLSTANNLIEGQEIVCDSEEQPDSCLLGYIYSPDSDEISQLPSPNHLGVLRADKMSLSGDGSLIVFTAGLNDPTGDGSYIQAYLYDRSRGTIETINQAPDGTPGNGNTYGAVIDATGRYVAFISESSSLVPDDTNAVADVFWRDRLTGEVVRVSISSGGEQGDANSGILAPGSGLVSLDISPDGQQIVYLSSASNLVDNPGTCSHAAHEMCTGVYLHDTRTGQTELVAPRRSNGFDYSPVLTGDGRWITYAGFRYDCQDYQYCSDIFRYDRQRGWAYNLTGYGGGTSGYAWTMLGSIDLPNLQTWSMAFSGDGRYLATANNDGRVRIFQLSDQTQVLTMECKSSAAIISLKFSPDNRWLAGGTTGGITYVWDLDAERLVYILDKYYGRVIDVFFSPDSSQLLIATTETLNTWHFGEKSLALVQRIPFEGPGVIDADLSPTGNLLASARQDGTVWLQMLPNGLLLARLEGDQTAGYDVVFSPDGSRLASRSVAGTLDIWQVSWQGFGTLEMIPLRRFSSTNWWGNLSFSADGSNLATILSSGGVGIWNIGDDRTYRFSNQLIEQVAFSPQGDYLATAANGSVDLLRGPGLIDGILFTHAEADILAEAELVSGGGVNELRLREWLASAGPGLNLYEADELWQHPLVAPANLPEGILFQGAYPVEDGGMLLFYTVDLDTGTNGTLSILEQPTVEQSLPVMTIGSNANIYERMWDGVRAEYTPGNWLPQVVGSSDGNGAGWFWDNNAVSEWLRWQSEQLFITMYFTTSPAGDSRLGLDNLAQMVRGFELVNPPPLGGQEMVEYLVQEGDTCTWLANRFRVSVDSIIAMNQLSDYCQIFSEQTLSIPIELRSYSMEDADFDCNGTEERLAVVMDVGVWVGIQVLTIGETGFYQPICEMTLEEDTLEWFSDIQILHTESCNSLLAIKVEGRYFSNWKLFSWDGAAMQPVEVNPAELERLLQMNDVE